MTTGPIATSTEVLSTAQCWELLRESVVGRLAVSIDDQPDIFPINHVVDHGSIVFRTAAGTKLFASVGHGVAFESDGYDLSTATAWSVVLRGPAREIWQTDEAIAALGLPLHPWQDGPKSRFIRIEPSSMSGRRFHVSGGADASASSSTTSASSSTPKE